MPTPPFLRIARKALQRVLQRSHCKTVYAFTPREFPLHQRTLMRFPTLANIFHDQHEGEPDGSRCRREAPPIAAAVRPSGDPNPLAAPLLRAGLHLRMNGPTCLAHHQGASHAQEP